MIGPDAMPCAVGRHSVMSIGIRVLLSCIVLTGTVTGPVKADVIATDCLARGGLVSVRWKASADPARAGFYLERLDGKTGLFTRITPDPVESSPFPWEESWYEAIDQWASPGQTNTYRVIELNTLGREQVGVPFSLCSRPATSGTVSLAPVSAVSQAMPPFSPVVQSVPGVRVKVHIEQTGMVEVPAQTLAANLEGETVETVTQRIGVGQFRLTCGTNNIAWTPSAGNTGIVFYATALDSIYTRQNVYWIERASGIVMSTNSPEIPAGDGGVSFREDVHIENEYTGNYGIFTDPEADIWFWLRMIVNTNKTTVNTVLVNLPWAQAGEGWVRAELKGSSTLPSVPPHHAFIYLNGLLLGSTTWNGCDVSIEAFPATNWVAGTNTVTIEGYSLAGELNGASFFLDSLDLSYSKLYRAFGDAIACSSESNAVIAVNGFSRSDIRVFDVTAPERPVVVAGDGVVVDSPVAGQWRVTFVPEAPMRRYWIVAGPPPVPVKIAGRPDVLLATQPYEVDYVVVYHESVGDGARALVDYRQSQGLASLGVDVEDVYDAFSHGIVTPHAIRAFLRHTREQWTRAPELVALAGSGNWDYRNARNATNDPCLIPPIMVPDNAPLGLVGCDMPLGDTDEDGIPEVVIGRLPALTSNEMWDVVHKIMAMESVATNVTVVSLVTDADDIGNMGPEQGNFSGNSDTVASMISSPFTRDFNYGLNLSSAGMTNVKERFVAQLNLPRTLLTYTGHANNTLLGSGGGGVLTAAELQRMTNSTPSLLLAMTCQFANFSLPFTTSADCLAERMIRKATGGVVGVWSCTASSYSLENTRLGRWLAKCCFRANGLRFGTALKEAMVSYAREGGAEPWVLKTYELLGDPALNLGFLNGEPATYDAWSQSAFTPEQQADPLISDPLADPDGDGIPNQQEFIAGTSPTNDLSGLRITAFTPEVDGRYAIRWPGVSNRLYSVEWSTNGMTTFRTRADYVWATQSDNVYVDAVDGALSPVFYRVRLMDAP